MPNHLFNRPRVRRMKTSPFVLRNPPNQRRDFPKLPPHRPHHIRIPSKLEVPLERWIRRVAHKHTFGPSTPSRDEHLGALPHSNLRSVNKLLLCFPSCLRAFVVNQLPTTG